MMGGLGRGVGMSVREIEYCMLSGVGNVPLIVADKALAHCSI